MEGKQFYDLEEPVEMRNSFVRLAYYPEARRFQLGRCDWIDTEGNPKHGKTVTLRLDKIQSDERKRIMEILRLVIAELTNGGI